MSNDINWLLYVRPVKRVEAASVLPPVRPTKSWWEKVYSREKETPPTHQAMTWNEESEMAPWGQQDDWSQVGESILFNDLYMEHPQRAYHGYNGGWFLPLMPFPMDIWDEMIQIQSCFNAKDKRHAIKAVEIIFQTKFEELDCVSHFHGCFTESSIQYLKVSQNMEGLLDLCLRLSRERLDLAYPEEINDDKIETMVNETIAVFRLAKSMK
jgi:hypothetical protein